MRAHGLGGVGYCWQGMQALVAAGDLSRACCLCRGYQLDACDTRLNGACCVQAAGVSGCQQVSSKLESRQHCAMQVHACSSPEGAVGHAANELHKLCGDAVRFKLFW
jgi:hypothetical protein